MGNAVNRIEINGKLYDAATGRPIAHTTPVKKPTQPIIHRPHSKKRTKTIDGFVRPAKSQARPASAPKAAARHPQRSATLMRQAVKKPVHHADGPSPTRIGANHHDRLKRAQSVPKSSAIKKFGPHSNSHHPAPAHHEKAKSHISAAHHTHAAPVAAEPPLVQDNSAHTRKELMLANAMNNARSHESLHLAKKPRRRLSHKLGFSRKATNLAAGALAVLLLGGFILYQNIPNLSMRLASERAGFNASLPGYKPSGFSLRGPIEYSPGKVTVSFRSNSDDRSYKLSQQVSNWNSQSLVDNFIKRDDRQYQTLEENGKTIYIYDGNNATWVSGGVWYQVEANSSLSSDQLVKIASST